MGKLERVIAWLLVILLLISNLLVLISADNARSIGYQRGFTEGQQWRDQDKYRTWDEWKRAGEFWSNARSEYLTRQYWKDYNQLIDEALSRAIAEGKGW